MSWKWWLRDAPVIDDQGEAIRLAQEDLKHAKEQYKEAKKVSRLLKIRREANHFEADIWEAYQQSPRWGHGEHK